MKGISAIVATILLLLITIGLATVAYAYFSNLISFRTSKSFQVLSPVCSGGTISLVVSNQGTANITNTAGSGDLNIIVDNKLNTTNFVENGVSGDTTYAIAPGQTIALVGNKTVSTGTHQVRVSTASDSQLFTVLC